MNSFIAWVGGKRILRKKIIELMPAHRTYVEVFGGAGWVLFGKEPSQVEAWNDINSDLVNLFRVVRNRLDDFERRFYFLLSSREEYVAFCAALKRGEFKDDIDRAIAFYYCIRNSFGSGIFIGWGFSPQTNPRNTDVGLLKAARERLKKVYIDHLSYDRLIPNWDRKETLFYCDPPYMVCLEKPGARGYYQCSFHRPDHERLRDILKGIKGKIILTYDNHPEIRRLYRRFNIQETEPVFYSMTNPRSAQRRHLSELIITNF